ncbi:MAG TPA: glycoside hydrolase family 20 zincin-like fold domain-containing protein [Streptosporangiaceae bacterium]|nr:glycoside hydrolase family 20 zincin-like fold domain-containing protein [Streptosporangiaceae bacterium]
MRTNSQSGAPAFSGSLLPRPRQLALGGPPVPFRPPITRLDPTLPPQGYRLRMGADGVSLQAADDAGAAYGRCTIAQLRRACGGELPPGEITDWPDQQIRGVMLDISRSKVPTLATLRDLADRLASWKINQLQLYMEHTFPYTGHEDVWRDASPVFPDEILSLDAYCRERHIELVPNQNTLGHFERWLRHGRYFPLAANPGGWRTGKGVLMEPMTLGPGPAARELIQDLLGQLLPWFSSRRVNAGLDEPWELGDDRVSEWAGWLAWLRSLRLLDGRELLIWGDVPAGHPGLLGSIPAGVTICDWGYDAGHPFDRRAEALAQAGIPFYLCPGTSSWNSIVGRLANAKANCAAAAAAANDHGACGYLVTDWGNGGHLQYQPVTEAALAYASGVAWCAEANRDMDLARVLDDVVFQDPNGQLGTAVTEMGDAYLALSAPMHDASPLTRHLWRPAAAVNEEPLTQVTRDGFTEARARITRGLDRLSRASCQRADGELVTAELRAGGELVTLLCDDAIARFDGDGTLASVPHRQRCELARAVDELARRHRDLWLARNRPGGLEESTRQFKALSLAYRHGG